MEFFRINKNIKSSSNFDLIYNLYTSLKREKGLITQEIIDYENSDCKNLSLQAYQFCKNNAGKIPN
jgi:hypothetical protein